MAEVYALILPAGVPSDAQVLDNLLTKTPFLARLSEALEHGWGRLEIVIQHHQIKMIHNTKTDYLSVYPSEH